jgi:PAS domain S-box-containing protein
VAHNIPKVPGDLPLASLPEGFGNRKELATVAFERSRTPMVITDARQGDNPIVLANKAFLDLTGYEAYEILGRNCRFMQGEATSEETIAKLREVIAAGVEMNIELLNYKRGGTTFWNELHISPICDDSGNVAYFFASQHDVTEKRKIRMLEASEHRLLMEVDHRANNVLAVVDSLVRLSKSDDPARYAAAVQQRIQALSRAHALLAEKRWEHVSLRVVIQNESQRFANGEIEIAGPEIDIDPSLVQPLTLVIHELMTNAAIHGALSKRNGRLVLKWDRIDERGGFRLTWTENGVPIPVAEPKAGVGMSIVQAMVDTQLAGRVHRGWSESRLKIQLEVPGAGRH